MAEKSQFLATKLQGIITLTCKDGYSLICKKLDLALHTMSGFTRSRLEFGFNDNDGFWPTAAVRTSDVFDWRTELTKKENQQYQFSVRMSKKKGFFYLFWVQLSPLFTPKMLLKTTNFEGKNGHFWKS